MTLSLTYEEAMDEVLTMFKAGWDPTGYKAFYDEVIRSEDGTIVEPSDEEPFIEVMFRVNTGKQVGFGGPAGQRIYERTGALNCRIYTPAVKGLSKSLELASVIADTFEGEHSPGGVWFTSINNLDMGRDGAFHLYLTSVFLKFHEIK